MLKTILNYVKMIQYVNIHKYSFIKLFSFLTYSIMDPIPITKIKISKDKWLNTLIKYEKDYYNIWDINWYHYYI